jgi:hypothetical protein
MYTVQKFSRVPMVTGRVISATGLTVALETFSWKGARLRHITDL